MVQEAERGRVSFGRTGWVIHQWQKEARARGMSEERSGERKRERSISLPLLTTILIGERGSDGSRGHHFSSNEEGKYTLLL